MEKIEKLSRQLGHHPIYNTFTELENIRSFMRYHVFAVWDFMTLLKSLQRHITCVDLPWRPSGFPSELVRFINQIVVGEESDIDQDGKPISHFELYLKAMEEVGASTGEIHDFLVTLNLNDIPDGAREFVGYNLEVAQNGHVVEVAASFFFGREKLIPAMFQTIVDTLKKNDIKAPTFLYYLERHIEIDGEEHGPLALKCLDCLIGEDLELRNKAMNSGELALMKRMALWDNVLLKQS